MEVRVYEREARSITHTAALKRKQRLGPGIPALCIAKSWGLVGCQ